MVARASGLKNQNYYFLKFCLSLWHFLTHSPLAAAADAADDDNHSNTSLWCPQFRSKAILTLPLRSSLKGSELLPKSCLYTFPIGSYLTHVLLRERFWATSEFLHKS